MLKFVGQTALKRCIIVALKPYFYCTLAPGASSQKKLPLCGQPTASMHSHLLQDGHITPGMTAESYRQRRLMLMSHICERTGRISEKFHHHLVLIPSSTKLFMSENIPFMFRQNTDFLYLTGFKEPDSVLVLHLDDKKISPDHVSILFIPQSDKHTERWEGPRTDINQATSFFGVDQAYYFDALKSYLHSYASRNANVILWFDYLSSPPKVYEVIKDFIANFSNVGFESPRSFIHKLRLIKSPPEVYLLEQTCKIAADSMTEVMKFSHPSVLESHLHAKMDFECRLRGADHLAFPPVVAGGDRANIIHYISNNQFISDGETVLMDAGCEFHGYSSDLTRTWPVSGKFTEAQKDIYELVLSVQEELIDMCCTFPSLDHLFQVMCQSMGSKLQELEIIPHTATKEEASKAAYTFCPHHVSHYLGMDVHDTSLISRGINIEPGMVITVEPGIYMQSEDHRIPAKYRGLCVRIEDDILITDKGARVLTSSCPKEVKAVEKLLSIRS